MVEFENPALLYLLLLIPALVVLFLWMRHVRKMRLRRFGLPEVLAPLMPDVSKYMPWVKLTVEMIVVLVLVLILARPIATTDAPGATDERTTRTSGIEIMLCVDVSNSMLASSTSDPEGTPRIQRARLLLEKLIDRLHNDKVGLIVFAGDAIVQLPITTDFISAKMFLGNIDPGMIPMQGTAIGQAIDMSVNALSGKSEFSKAIIVITDGENFEDDAIASAKAAERAGIRVDVIGVGTAEGAPIPAANGGYLTMNGEEVITRLNAEEASEIAKAGGGVYVDGNAGNAVNRIISNLDDLAKKDYTRVTHSPAAEQFPVLAWLALILLVVNVLVVTRKISWLRGFNFFSRTPAKEHDNRN